MNICNRFTTNVLQYKKNFSWRPARIRTDVLATIRKDWRQSKMASDVELSHKQLTVKALQACLACKVFRHKPEARPHRTIKPHSIAQRQSAKSLRDQGISARSILCVSIGVPVPLWARSPGKRRCQPPSGRPSLTARAVSGAHKGTGPQGTCPFIVIGWSIPGDRTITGQPNRDRHIVAARPRYGAVSRQRNDNSHYPR